MTWTTPTTRATGDLVTAAIWNTDVVNNLKYLKGGGSSLQGTGSGDAGTSATSAQTFAATGAAALSIAIAVTDTAAPVEIGLNYHYTSGAGATNPAGYIDFLDSVSGSGVDGKIFQHRSAGTATTMQAASIVWHTSSLAAGTHTITPRLWSANGSWGFYVSDNTVGLHYTFWVVQGNGA